MAYNPNQYNACNTQDESAVPTVAMHTRTMGSSSSPFVFAPLGITFVVCGVRPAGCRGLGGSEPSSDAESSCLQSKGLPELK